MALGVSPASRGGTAPLSSPTRSKGSKAHPKGDVALEQIQCVEAWYAEDPAVNDKLVRLTRELASESPALVRPLCEALVKALSVGSKDISGAALHIGGRTFPSRDELKASVQQFLRIYAHGALLNNEDFAFMREVLAHHPRGMEKLHRCDAMTTGVHPRRPGLKCFYVVRKEGTEDFGYLRCVENAPTREVKAQERLCAVLCEVLDLHPVYTADVAQMIQEMFPTGVKCSVERQRNWARSILRLCTRMPSMSEYLLRVLVRRMVEIDAEIHRMEGDLPDHDEMHGAGGSPVLRAAVSEKEKKIHLKMERMANVLDAMMVLFFEFLQRHIQPSTSLDPAIGGPENRLVAALLTIFEQTVLLTHQVRYVQFLWFFLASLRPAWSEAFLTLLLQTAYSPNQAMTKRYIALTYAASFVARSNSLTTMYALRTAQYISAFAHEHMQVAEAHVAAGELDHPQVLLFLSAVQAVCYLMCFHADDFAQCKGSEFAEFAGSTALDALLPEPGNSFAADAFTPVLASSSRPIVRINHHVAAQFCRSIRPHRQSMAHHLSERLNEFKSNGCKGQYQGDAEGLEVFFPFDPYRLRHSSMFVLSIYREWGGRADDEDIELDENDGFLGGDAPPAAPARGRAGSGTTTDNDEAHSDADFTEMADAVDRGFVPSVQPSPAFRPMPMHMASPMLAGLSPLCVPMDTADEDDESVMLPPASVDTVGSDVLSQLLGSAAYISGRSSR